MTRKYLKIIHLSIAIIIVVLTIFLYLPLLFCNFELLVNLEFWVELYLLFIIILFIFPAILSIIQFRKISKTLFFLNSIGLLLHVFVLIHYHDLIFYEH